MKHAKKAAKKAHGALKSAFAFKQISGKTATMDTNNNDNTGGLRKKGYVNQNNNILNLPKISLDIKYIFILCIFVNNYQINLIFILLII